MNALEFVIEQRLGALLKIDGEGRIVLTKHLVCAVERASSLVQDRGPARRFMRICDELADKLATSPNSQINVPVAYALLYLDKGEDAAWTRHLHQLVA